MHHEDLAGVNALIRGIDHIGGGNHPAIVVLCTNRIEALDPAIVRRAADIFHFKRPNLEQRLTILGCSLSGLGFDNGQIQAKLIPRWNPHLWGTENRLWYTGGILPLIEGRSCDVVEPRSRNAYCTLALVQSVSVVAGLYPCTPLSLNERTDLAIHSPE